MKQVVFIILLSFATKCFGQNKHFSGGYVFHTPTTVSYKDSFKVTNHDSVIYYWFQHKKRDSVYEMIVFSGQSFKHKWLRDCGYDEYHEYVRGRKVTYSKIRNYCLQDAFVIKETDGWWMFEDTNTMNVTRKISLHYKDGKILGGKFGELNTGPETFQLNLDKTQLFIKEYYYEPLSFLKFTEIKEGLEEDATKK
ncbi:MAG: hypothetical protein JST82_03835 [Bacteroidetes bacterium]|nr:hypothetical protein [Bacteroidota bacterium]